MKTLRRENRVSGGGRTKVERAIARGWTPWSGRGVGSYLRQRRAKKVRRA